MTNMRMTNPGMKYTNNEYQILQRNVIRNSKFLAFHSSFVIRIFVIHLFPPPHKWPDPEYDQTEDSRQSLRHSSWY